MSNLHIPDKIHYKVKEYCKKQRMPVNRFVTLALIRCLNIDLLKNITKEEDEEFFAIFDTR